MAFSSSTNCRASTTRSWHLVFGDAFFVQAVGDVIFDVEGIEERAFLKDHADVGAHFVDFCFATCCRSDLPKMRISPESGSHEAVGELHEHAFANAGRAEDDAGFAAHRRGS